ncbi:MAG: hypothetical protein HC818_03290 [Synechococcaceae cyanobacterium RM1_1_27]|nr:hypothetical protein [Synechococcaceae cyanobacterium RM1_1_27]
MQDWAMSQAHPTRQRLYRPQPKHNGSSHQAFDTLELDAYSELHVLVQSLADSFAPIEDQLRSLQGHQTDFELKRRKRLLDQAQEELLLMRMVPVGTVLQRFSQVLEQLQSSHQKPVQLSLRGKELLVDKSLVEKLYDPLLHLVRNAFDHGIEPQAERLQQGKPASGQIAIAAFRQGNRTVIEVRDDGKGLDWERIRQKGIQQGRLNPEENPSQEHLQDLLFESGFSTAPQVTQLSGRGVGLDVVRSQIHALQGSITIRSQPGQGTTFSLYLPLTLSTERLLVCRCGGIPYALLTNAIVQLVLPEQIQHYSGFAGEHRALRWGDGDQAQWLPIRSLGKGMTEPPPVKGSTASNKPAPLLLLGSPDIDAERMPIWP